MIGQIQDLLSAAVVIGATNASASVSEGTQAAAPVQTGSQQQPDTNAQEAPAASVDILNQVKNAANETDKTQPDPLDKNQKDDDKKLDEKSVSYITQELNELMSRINCDLEFKYHKEVNTMSVKMLDKKTGDVLKEVPPEDLIKHMIKAKDWLGAFLDKTI